MINMDCFSPTAYFQQVYQLSMQCEYALQNQKSGKYTDSKTKHVCI